MFHKLKIHQLYAGYILIPEAIYWGYSVLQSADGRTGLSLVLGMPLFSLLSSVHLLCPL